jgi:aspartate/methionine/tyrosine aminotransferase
MAFLNAGDSLVTFEPMFPMYLDHAEMAGGKILGVPLTYSDSTQNWEFSMDELRRQLSHPSVKMFLFNTPHNPTGRIFSVDEMAAIGKMIETEFPHIVVVSDEVYDFLTFDGKKHTPFAAVGNNWERTVSVYSGGKLFNATGWKLGWAIGPEPILRMGGIISNTVFYTGNTPG